MNASMETQRKQDTCANVKVPSAIWNLPDDADTPLPPNPVLEDIAMGHHHHSMTGNNNDDNTVETAPSTEIPDTVKRPNGNGNKFLKTDTSRNNPLLNNRLKSQGRYPTSYNNGMFSSDLLDNVNRDGYGDYDLGGRSPYLVDYPSYDDYYDVVRQRNRNRLKQKPTYDLYDTQGNLGLEFPSQSYPALSRNRNKQFNEKYDEYAGTGINGGAKSVSAKKGDKGGLGGGNKVVDKTKTLSKSSSSNGDKQVEGIAVL